MLVPFEIAKITQFCSGFFLSCRENLKIRLKDITEQKKCIKENGIIVDGTHHGVQFVGKVINCFICNSTSINDYMHGTIKIVKLRMICIQQYYLLMYNQFIFMLLGME